MANRNVSLVSCPRLYLVLKIPVRRDPRGHSNQQPYSDWLHSARTRAKPRCPLLCEAYVDGRCRARCRCGHESVGRFWLALHFGLSLIARGKHDIYCQPPPTLHRFQSLQGMERYESNRTARIEDHLSSTMKKT